MAAIAEPQLLSVQYNVSFSEHKEHFAGTKRPVDIREKRYTKHFYVTDEGKKDTSLTNILAANTNADQRFDGDISSEGKKSLVESWIADKLVKLHCPTDENGFKQPAIIGEALAGEYRQEEWSVVEEYFVLNGVEQNVTQPDGTVTFAETDYFASTRDIKVTKSKDQSGWPKEIKRFYPSGEPEYIEHFGELGHENRGPHQLSIEYFTEGGLITSGSMRKNDKGEMIRLNARQIEEIGGVIKQEGQVKNGYGFVAAPAA